MKIASYKCKKCNNIFDNSISDIEWKNNGFPEYIFCSKCNSKSKKIISNIPSHIKIGRVGNYKNGYTSQQGYIKKT